MCSVCELQRAHYACTLAGGPRHLQSWRPAGSHAERRGHNRYGLLGDTHLLSAPARAHTVVATAAGNCGLTLDERSSVKGSKHSVR